MYMFQHQSHSGELSFSLAESGSWKKAKWNGIRFPSCIEQGKNEYSYQGTKRSPSEQLHRRGSPGPGLFSCLQGNKLHTTKGCCGFLSENGMIELFLTKHGQLFESLYIAFSCIDLTKSGLVILGFLKENIQFASVERRLLWLLPQFSFSFGRTVRHRPTMLCLGWSSPNAAALQHGAGAGSCGWWRVLLPAAAAALQHSQELLHTC